MKKLIVSLLLVSMASAGIICSAATTASVGVQATVPSKLELSYWIREAPGNVDPYGPGSADATSLNFGTLVFDDINAIWMAEKYFTVFLIGASSGRPYRIEQTNAGFAVGNTNLNNSLIMSPDYQNKDKWSNGIQQGNMPGADSFNATPVLAFGTHTIYNGNAGKARIARAYYGLATGDPVLNEPNNAEVITGDQLSGTYSGRVTFSVVLQ